ncbi:MAG: anaerobic ribonucleoside-triphosphate reductase activating protein [archaeon]
MPIDIKGLQKMDLMNFGSYPSATVFLSRCNFSCPFCHNPELVSGYEKIKSMPEDEVISFLISRKQWYDGVCITGGEPTLHKDLPKFISRLKKEGFKVKLDTNGTNPKMIAVLLEQNLVDYIAMDIKSPFEKYDFITRVKTDIAAIKESIKLIMESNIDYEFRTTIIPKFHKKEDIIAIAKAISGAKRYVLQQFRSTENMLDNSLKDSQIYTKEELMEIKSAVEPYFKEILIHNI